MPWMQVPSQVGQRRQGHSGQSGKEVVGADHPEPKSADQRGCFSHHPGIVEHEVQPTPFLVVQQGELAPRTQEHPSQERVGTSMLTQCTLGFEVAHPHRSGQPEHFQVEDAIVGQTGHHF